MERVEMGLVWRGMGPETKPAAENGGLTEFRGCLLVFWMVIADLQRVAAPIAMFSDIKVSFRRAITTAASGGRMDRPSQLCRHDARGDGDNPIAHDHHDGGQKTAQRRDG